MSPDAATLHPPAVSLREAAQALGVSEAAVRRMVKSGALTGIREPRPQGHVWRIHLPEHLSPAPDAEAAAPPDGTLRRQDPLPAVEGARAEALAAYAATLIAPHLATIERLAGELQAQAYRVGELEQQLAGAQARVAELEADPSRIPAAASGDPEGERTIPRGIRARWATWWARWAGWRR